MKVPESLPKLLQAVKWSCRDDVAEVSCISEFFAGSVRSVFADDQPRR